MYRQILVPVDGSNASLMGLRHAFELAKDQQARVRVINVVDEAAIMPIMMDPVGAGMTNVLDSLRSDGQKVLANARQAADKAGVRAECVQIASRAQPVSDIILADAKRSKADVIVMGTHGRRGLNRLLLGSDAERVLRESRVPVLLVRQEPSKRAARTRATTSKTSPRPRRRTA